MLGHLALDEEDALLQVDAHGQQHGIGFQSVLPEGGRLLPDGDGMEMCIRDSPCAPAPGSGAAMTRAEFEQAAYLEEELRVLENRPGQQARVRELRSLLEEARAIPRRLPDPKARLVAQKVLEHGTPIPWKRIVAELGYRWTVGKARYAYSRVCALCFSPRER